MTRTGMLRISEPLASREGKLTLLALLMMLYVMALFVSIAFHEVLGHGMSQSGCLRQWTMPRLR
jgi:hypothetical protein